jgi:Protein of unknown function (DUF4235)
LQLDEEQVWNGVASGAAIGAVLVTRPVVERLWTMVFRREPPGNPASRDTSWTDALLWALFTGAIVGVIRLLAQRGAAGAWNKARGDYPKGLRHTHA